MSINDFNSKRELSARQDYTKALVYKRDMLAKRIKGDDKKRDLDINKIFTEIKNGNLSVLEDLDKAGISYTLNNNGQAFDDKSDSYSVTFEVYGVKYTAYHEGLTKEQEEAKKEQEAKGRARLESFLNQYEGVKTEKRENNASSAGTADVKSEQPTVTLESENSIVSETVVAPDETVVTSVETTTQSKTTIYSKPSEAGTGNNTLESQLLENIQMLSEHPEYQYDSTINIMKLLEEMNIKYFSIKDDGIKCGACGKIDKSSIEISERNSDSIKIYYKSASKKTFFF